MSTDTHSYSLRSARENPLGLRENQTRIRETKVGFSNLGPKIWNTIPEKIKQLKSRDSFKNHLKQHILEGYAEKLTCSNPLCKDRRFHVH